MLGRNEMKKIICIALSIFFIFTLTSCDNAEEKDGSYTYSTVYVSRYGKIHSDANCSGMKYYTAMPLDKALDAGNVLCKKCYPPEELQKAYEDHYENYYDHYEDYYYQDDYHNEWYD